MTQTETLTRPAADLILLTESLEGPESTCRSCRGRHKVTCTHPSLDEDDFCLSCDEVPSFRRGRPVPHAVSCNACL